MSTVASAAAAAYSSSTTATSSPVGTASAVFAAVPSLDQGKCSLLGSSALFVQAALGALALLSLVYKRWRERPQRPPKIWFFDVSKQVFGSALAHISNILTSMLTSAHFSIDKVGVRGRGTKSAESEDQYIPNPCSWYLLNLAIDASFSLSSWIMP